MVGRLRMCVNVWVTARRNGFQRLSTARVCEFVLQPASSVSLVENLEEHGDLTELSCLQDYEANYHVLSAISLIIIYITIYFCRCNELDAKTFYSSAGIAWCMISCSVLRVHTSNVIFFNRQFC